MSAEYKPVPVKRFPRLGLRTTAEDRFWKRLKVRSFGGTHTCAAAHLLCHWPGEQHPIIVKEFAAVSSIGFSPVSPHDFAVSSSTRVQIYSADRCTVKRSLTRFKDVAYGGSYRHDGQLLVAGGETGLVQVFDVNSRAILRRFEGHTSPVHTTKFTADGLHVFSGGDDKSVRYWDMAHESEVAAWTAHTDYVRCGAVAPLAPHLFLSGGYDHHVHLWDARAGKNVLTVDHGAPVEALVFFPSTSSFASAGGTTVKVWETLGRLAPLFTLNNHQKTVTSASRRVVMWPPRVSC